MNTETVNFTTATGQAFGASGIQGFSNASAPPVVNPNAVSPNAIRWLFNPFAYVDISNRPISGHAQLKAGVFIPITPQTQRISKSGISSSPGKRFDWQDGNTPQALGVATPENPRGEYYNDVRTAFAIASEIEDAYADKGVKILDSMTKFDDQDAIRAIYKTLVADGLVYNNDVYQPDFPVPNLVVLENYLLKTSGPAAAQFPDTLSVNPSAVVADLLVSVRAAISHCRTVTRDAKRVVANKTTGYQHTFDAYSSRCFVALGEQVPSDLGEMYGKTQEASAAAPSAELERLRSENEQLRLDAAQREIDQLRAENEALKSRDEQSRTLPMPESATVKCDFIKADETRCKGNASKFGRCGHHPRETGSVDMEEKDNVNREEAN